MGVKAKKSAQYGKSKKKQERQAQKETSIDQKLQHLDDVFAGSSEDEDDNQVEADGDSVASDGKGSGSSQNDEESGFDDAKKRGRNSIERVLPKRRKFPAQDGHEADDSSSGDDGGLDTIGGVQSDDDDEWLGDSQSISAKSMGMANAMARILHSGSSTSAGTKATSAKHQNAKEVGPVLSKTTTKLQKAQMEEKETQVNEYKKRQQRRKENLQCMHIPLSVRTGTSQGIDPAEVAKEIQAERAHRRIATRGVVALFNAIAQHQGAKKKEDADEGGKDKHDTNESMPKTKYAFLEKIKGTASSGDKNDEITSRQDDKIRTNKAGKKSDGAKEVSWGALKDDFMMAPKLKDWDKDDDDDESMDEDQQEAGFDEEDDDLSI
jgi:hypothetical protein